MMLAHRRRGEPLLAMGLLVAGWLGVRALAWDQAFEEDARAGARQAGESAAAPAGPGSGRWLRSGSGMAQEFGNAPESGNSNAAMPDFSGHFAPPPPRSLFAPLVPHDVPSGVFVAPREAPLGAPASADGEPDEPSSRIAVAGGHQLLWLAATALLPMPPLGIQPAPAPQSRELRWSGDGWLLLRRGNGPLAPGPAYGTYGASQAGAVIRYRLDQSDPRKPGAYLRATAALNGTREQEAALGLSARPLARVPVVAMAEARALRDTSGVHLRPAVLLVTELPPQPLPLGFSGEFYAQGGYIGGHNATAFIDGLARAERPVTDIGGTVVRAGGGAWGARQRGAGRLDLGPVASVAFRLNDTASARLEADWRFRVAGRAKPDSGPALTLSAGF